MSLEKTASGEASVVSCCCAAWVTTAIKLRHNHDCGGDFSRPVTAQWATEVAPTSAVILSDPLNLMAVAAWVGANLFARTTHHVRINSHLHPR